MKRPNLHLSRILNVRTDALFVASNVIWSAASGKKCAGEAGADMFGHNERPMFDLTWLERYVFTASDIDEQFCKQNPGAPRVSDSVL